MNYRVRKQWLTGKLILQIQDGTEWIDADADTHLDSAFHSEFVLLGLSDWERLYARSLRADKADKRSAAQRKAYAEKKAKQ